MHSDPDDETPAALTTLHCSRARHGDAASLGWLVERLSPLLLAHAAVRMGPELRQSCDPADMVHEAWLITLPRLGELPARDGRHTPVLLKFLSTTILLRIRNLKRRLNKSRAAGEVTDDPAPLDELAASQSGVVSRAVRRELHGEVRRALEELDDVDREVILLRGVEQVTNATAGMLLGMSAEAVSKRYVRALQKLRKGLRRSVLDELENG